MNHHESIAKGYDKVLEYLHKNNIPGKNDFEDIAIKAIGGDLDGFIDFHLIRDWKGRYSMHMELLHECNPLVSNYPQVQGKDYGLTVGVISLDDDDNNKLIVDIASFYDLVRYASTWNFETTPKDEVSGTKFNPLLYVTGNYEKIVDGLKDNLNLVLKDKLIPYDLPIFVDRGFEIYFDRYTPEFRDSELIGFLHRLETAQQL